MSDILGQSELDAKQREYWSAMILTDRITHNDLYSYYFDKWASYVRMNPKHNTDWKE